MEEEDVLGSADAAVNHLRELSDALEQRLKQRSAQQALDQLLAAPRPSAFTTAEDQKLLERPLPPPMPFPSAVDRQPGHTSHSFSPTRGRSPVRSRPGAGPSLAAEPSSTSSTSPVRRSTGLLGGSLASTAQTGLGGTRGLGGTAGRGGSVTGASTEGMTEGQVLAKEIEEAAASPALSYLVRAAATAAAYSKAEGEGRTGPSRAGAGPGAALGASQLRSGAPYGSVGYQGQGQGAYMGRVGTGSAVGTTTLSSAGMLQMLRASAVPGQRQYRQALAAVQGSRVADVSAFQREMAAIDDEIDSYVSDFKYELNVPDAALALQAAWRARGPRLLLNRFRAVRTKALRRHARVFLLLLAQLARACLHGRRRLMRRCFQEWRDIILLKLELYRKIIMRLKASMIDVRDSQSPNHLWHLCTAPGEDPWKARLNLGRLVANILLNQAPRRKTKFYFESWLGTIRKLTARRREAAAKLAAIEVKRTKEQVLGAFRFWFRYAVVKVATRLSVEPPLFRPRMPEWDAWLWEHNRTRDLTARIAQLHRTFRLTYCFRWWHKFVARNMKLRKAWSGAAAKQIEALLRYSLNAMKANWRYATYRRKTRTAVLRAWLNLTRRNKEVRRISIRVEVISRRSILSQCMRRLRTYARMGSLLAAGAAVRMWQRRTLAVSVMYAWTGDTVHMWFALAFHHWRAAAVGRLRFKCLLAAHMQRIECGLPLELAFKAWRKVAVLRAHARNMAVQAARHKLYAHWEEQDAQLALLVATQLGASFKLDATPKAIDMVSESSSSTNPSDDTPAPAGAQPARPTLHWSNTFRPVRQGAGAPTTMSQLPPISQDSNASDEAAERALVSHASGMGRDDAEEQAEQEKGTEAPPLSRLESAATHSTHASAALAMGASQLSMVSVLGRVRSRPLSHRSGHSEPLLTREESEAAAVETAVRAAEEAFDESDGILVTIADFPMYSIWRPLTARAVMMRSNDQTSSGLSKHKLDQMLDQLVELEGLFNPRLQPRQLMLDVARRGETTPLHALYLSTDTATAHHWRESGTPDELLWQRVVGLRATAAEPFPDHVSRWLLDEDALPLREEVEPIQAVNRNARSSPMLLSKLSVSGAPSRDRSVSGAAARTSVSGAPAADAEEEGMPAEVARAAGMDEFDSEETAEARQQRQAEAAERVASLGLLLSGEQKVTMYLYKLAEAEQLLETCACTLLGVGDSQLPTVYSLLAERAEPGELQGDMLVSLLSSALSHDTMFMHANMVYCNNRDRVITMGLELHEKAKALHMHRPEFTLLYTDREGDGVGTGKSRRKGVSNQQPSVKIDFENWDSSDSDIPSPRPKTPMQLLREEAERAVGTPDGKKAGQKAAAMVASLTGGILSPAAGNTATRGQLNFSTPSKSHLIKMEMMGKDMAAAAAALTSDSPTAGMMKRTSWLPKAATVHTISSKSRSSTPAAEASEISLDASRPSTLRRRSLAIEVAAEDVPSPRRESSTPKVAFGRTKSASTSNSGWRPTGYQKSKAQNGGLSPSPAGTSRLRTRSVGRPAGHQSTGRAKTAGTSRPDEQPRRLKRVSSVPTLLPAPVPRTGSGGKRDTPGFDSVSASPAPPATGYQWFSSAARLFPSISDVPAPADTPTMMDLEHMCQRLVGESLPHFFGIPPLPAIVFTRWGEFLEPGELPVAKTDQPASELPPSREKTPQELELERSWEDMAVAAWNAEASKAEDGHGATAGSVRMPEANALDPERAGGAGVPGAEARQEEVTQAAMGAEPEHGSATPSSEVSTASAGVAAATGAAVVASAAQASAAEATGPAPPLITEPDADADAGAYAEADAKVGLKHERSAEVAAGSRSGSGSESGQASEQASAAADELDGEGEVATEAVTAVAAGAPLVPPLKLTPEVLAAAARQHQEAGGISLERKSVRLNADEPSTHRSHIADALSSLGNSARILRSVDSRIGEDHDVAAIGAKVAATLLALSHRDEVLEAGEEAYRARVELRASRQATEDGGGSQEGSSRQGSHSASSASSGGSVSSSASGSSAESGEAGEQQQQGQGEGEGGEGEGAEERLSRRRSGGSRAASSAGHGRPSREESQVSAVSRRKRAAVERPVFVPSARQIDIFLGGHLRGRRRPPEPEEQEEAKEKVAGQASVHAMAEDAPVKPITPEHAFDPQQVIHTDSMRERNLLDGFDLAEELERLKGTKEHVPGLASELRALEVELAMVLGRKRPRRRRHGKANSHASGSVRSFGNLETSTIQSMSSYQDDYQEALSTVQSMEHSRVGTPLYEVDGEYPDDAPMRSTTAPSRHLGGALLPGGKGTDGDLRASTAPDGTVLSPGKALALAGEEVPSPSGRGNGPLSPWGQTGTDGTVVAHGESMRLSVRLRDYKPAGLGHGGASMMPASSRRPFGMAQMGMGLMSELEGGSPPAGPTAAAMIDPATVFPDRPNTVDSAMGGVYPESATSSALAAATLMHLGDAGRRGAARVSGAGSGASLGHGSEGSEAAEGPADLLFLTGLSGASGGRHPRRRTNLRTGGQALQPLSAEAFAGRPPTAPSAPTAPVASAATTANAMPALDPAAVASAAPAAAPPPPSSLPVAAGAAGRPASTTRSRPASGSAPPTGPPPPPPPPPPPLPPVPAELASLPEDAVAELQALEEMWSSKLYSGDVSPYRDQGLDPGEMVQQMIAQADQDAWRQYEEGASRFVDELSSILAKQDQQPEDGDRGTSGARPSDSTAQHDIDPRSHNPHQLMRALAVMEDHVAASLDPDKLTGLRLNSYPAQLSSLLSKLIVAPLATKFLFWKKVQSLAALKQRLMDDKALQQQLKEVAWADGFDIPAPPKPAGPSRVPPGLARGGQSSSWFLGPGGMAASGGLEAHRAPWAPLGPLPPTGYSQPLRSSRIELKPRDDSPAGAVNLVNSQASIGNFFQRERSSDLASGVSARGSQAQQHQHPPPHPAAWQQGQDGHQQPQQQQQQQAVLLMSSEDVQQLAVPPLRDQLLRQQQELLYKRRQLQAAIAVATEAGPEAMLYAPTLDEEAEVVEKLAQVTVALHRDTLKRARRAAGLPDDSGNSGGTAAFGRGQAVPHWLRDREGGREGFQASPDPWFHAPRHATAAAIAAAPPPVVTTHGATRPHATASSVQELAVLASGISGGRVASAALRPGAAFGLDPAGTGRANSPTAQGQGRPLRGPGAVPSPLAPIVNPPVFPAAAIQSGNVQLIPGRPSAYVDRSLPPQMRPSVLSASSAPLSARSPPRKGSASPRRLPATNSSMDKAPEVVEQKPDPDGGAPGPWVAKRETHSPMHDPRKGWDQGHAGGPGAGPAGGAGAPLLVSRPVASAPSPLQAWDEDE